MWLHAYIADLSCYWREAVEGERDHESGNTEESEDYKAIRVLLEETLRTRKELPFFI